MSAFFNTSSVRIALFTLGGCILLLSAFQIGIHVGVRKAEHLNRWGRSYPTLFRSRAIGFRNAPPLPFAPSLFPSGHGAFGKIVSVSDTSLIVSSTDGREQPVRITSSTQIRIGTNDGSLQALTPDQTISVFGRPTEEGAIDARLIRVHEVPPSQPL